MASPDFGARAANRRPLPPDRYMLARSTRAFIIAFLMSRSPSQPRSDSAHASDGTRPDRVPSSVIGAASSGSMLPSAQAT